MKLLTSILLLALVVAGALAVMTVRHQHRVVFDRLHQAVEQRDRYQMDWGRLMLERATWQIHNTTEEANRRLGMSPPNPDEIVFVALTTHAENGEVQSQ